MAITQRKIQKTGGGSSASAVGVQQIATPKSNIGSNVQSLAKSLGVIMDTSVSPHEQAQLDKVSSDEYRKLEVSLKGKSPEEQDRLRADHRARFTEANKGGFIENLLNKPNPRLQGYNQATNTSLKYGTIDALAQLQKGFTEEHDETYRTNALIAMYDSQNAKAEGMSAEVAQQWRADAEELFDDSYVKVRNDADVLQKNQAVSLVNRATDDQLLHLTPANLVGKDDSLESSESVTDSLYTVDTEGTKVLDPKFVKKSISIVQAMRAEVKIQNPQLTTDQLNVMVNEKYKFVAETYNSPELFDAIMAETNATGMTGRELNPKFAQETSDALHEESIKKKDNLTKREQISFTKSSKEYTEGRLAQYEELEVRAQQGDLDAINELSTSTEALLNDKRNNPDGTSNSDYIALINKTQALGVQYRNFKKTEQTVVHDRRLTEAVANPSSITDIDDTILENSNATPARMKWFKSKMASRDKLIADSGFESKKAFNEYTKSIKDSADLSANDVISEVQDELAIEIAEFKTQTEGVKNVAVPTGAGLKSKMRQAWRERIYLETSSREEAITHDEWKGIADDFINKELPRYKQQYTRELKQYMQDNKLAPISGLSSEGGSDPKPTDGSTTPSEPKATVEPKTEPLNVAELNRIASSMGVGTTPDTISPTGGVEADTQRTMELRIEEFRTSDPVGYIKKAVETGNTGLARKEITNSLVTDLKTVDSPTVYDAVTSLVDNLSTNHPELIGSGDEVDANLTELSNVIGEAITQLGSSSDPRVRTLHKRLVDSGLHDRDNKGSIDPSMLDEILNSPLLPRYEDTPIGDSYNRMQESLRKVRGR